MPLRVASIILSCALVLGFSPMARAESARVEPYDGLATWLDIYDRKPWLRPETTVARLRAKGVRTLYLQTSNWQKRKGVMKPVMVGRFLDAANSAGIRVVAWYVPSFKKPREDLQRSMQAIEYESPGGRRFDAYAMDIEAVNVRDITKRNARLMWVSERIRQKVGADYALGAIIPDPKTQRYWPRFPYRQVASLYDVFLPMSYFTFRTGGYARVYRYTRDSLDIIRERTGRSEVPIHIIGGLAGDASRKEVSAFTKGVREHGAIGASLYDLPLMTPGDWGLMKNIVKQERSRPTPRPKPEIPRRFARYERVLSALYL